MQCHGRLVKWYLVSGYTWEVHGPPWFFPHYASSA